MSILGASSTSENRLAPIAGVTLAVFAQINVEFSDRGYDPAVAKALAARRGISTMSWREAVAGWNRRIAEHPQVAVEFERLYAEAAASLDRSDHAR